MEIHKYTGTTLTTRTWGLDLSGSLQGAGGVGGLLAEKQGANTYYPTYDGNGNVSEYLEADGDVAAHYEYDPFGNIVKESYASGFVASSFSYKFSTKPLDPTTGLYYYTYRWYDPLTGRWPSRDPIEERGGMNLYGFTENNPINKIDILGNLGDPCNRPKWPEFPEEGTECSVPPAEIEFVVLGITLKTASTGWTDYVPVKATIDWRIKGTYIGPRWIYSTCERGAPQLHPDPHGKSGGQIPWCDDGDCEFNACDPQITAVHFHFLSCECEWTEEGRPTGKTVWTRKRYIDTATVEGDRSAIGRWTWSVINSQPFSQDRSDQTMPKP
jgi:RHS repeat-associated protein